RACARAATRAPSPAARGSRSRTNASGNPRRALQAAHARRCRDGGGHGSTSLACGSVRAGCAGLLSLALVEYPGRKLLTLRELRGQLLGARTRVHGSHADAEALATRFGVGSDEALVSARAQTRRELVGARAVAERADLDREATGWGDRG